MKHIHRFLVTEGVEGSTLRLAGAGLHHLRDVLRAKPGDEVIVCDGRGSEARCIVSEVGPVEAVLTVVSQTVRGVAGVSLTVACALPKGPRMDDIVDTLTQLGVDTIIPMETERVVVKLDGPARDARLRRWQRIAQSAAEQSRQARVTLVEPVAAFEDVLRRSGDFELKLIPALCEERRPIREVLAESAARSTIVLIGPEGDFTPREVEQARAVGFVPVSLGRCVLRVATAAAAVASYIRLSLSS